MAVARQGGGGICGGVCAVVAMDKACPAARKRIGTSRSLPLPTIPIDSRRAVRQNDCPSGSWRESEPGMTGGSSILHPAGPIAAANRAILFNALGVMLAVVIPTILLAIATAWWFRANNRHAQRDETFVYSGRVELVVWSIPLLVILFLGGVIWVGSHKLDPTAPIETESGAPPLQVEVVSLDWRWLFIYPEQGIATINRLVLPVGRPVRFRLTSASVMNAFFVPRLGSMVYTMNGMATVLNLLAAEPGRYEGLSAHYSGEGFADMRFDTLAVSPAKFAEWAAQVKALDGAPAEREDLCAARASAA